MSIWSTIGGIAAGIGTGILTGNPAAGIAVGGSIIGSGIQSDQISKAAQKQQEGTEKALGIQSQIYNQTRADLDPYMSLGTGAVGNLRGLVGLPASQPSRAAVGNTLQSLNPNAAQPTAYQPMNVVDMINASRQGQQAMNNSGSSYVAMQGPDGSVRNVPYGDVRYWLNNGGSLVKAAS